MSRFGTRRTGRVRARRTAGGDGMEVNRSDALLSVYAEISAEIARLRDNEFRTAFLSLALNAGMIAVFTNDRVATRAGALERWAAIVSMTCS